MAAIILITPFRRLGFVVVAVPALLFAGSACARAIMGRTDIGSNGGLIGPPGVDAATMAYVTRGVHFDDAKNGHVDVKSIATGKVVRFEPEETSDTVNWHDALTDDLTEGGKIVARVSKVRNQLAPELGLNDTHEFAYMWVGPLNVAGTERAVAFYTFKKNGEKDGGPYSKFYVITRCADFSSSRKPYVMLNRNHGSAKCSESRGLGAPRGASTALLRLASSAAKPTAAFAAGGLWISCSGGCCDVGGGAFE